MFSRLFCSVILILGNFVLFMKLNYVEPILKKENFLSLYYSTNSLKKTLVFGHVFTKFTIDMSVYYNGKIILENVCAAYTDNEAALFADLGNENPRAIRCLTRRLKPSVQATAAPYRLSEQEIDDIVTETVIKTIINIQRGRL